MPASTGRPPMKRATLISRGTLNRIFADANEAWKRCDFQRAFDQMERARRLDPANVDVLLSLGRMHGQRFDYAQAENSFERALKLTGQRTDVLIAAARESKAFNHLALAERYLNTALAQNDLPAEAVVLLGEICERARRFDEARALAERALNASPGCGPARLLRARLERQVGRLEAAEQTLRDFPSAADPALRASASYELGGVLDRQGRYDEAMNAFLAAKALLQPQAYRPAHELKVMRARIQHLTDHATADCLKAWQAEAAALPPAHRIALLGGHPRSGTTLLEQVLDTHPDIISAEETEIFQHDAYGPLMLGQPDDTAMFDGLAAATAASLQTVRASYFHSMNLSLGEAIGPRLLIDKNPSYTFLLPAFARVFPEIKLLIALRDPRDVALSCFMQNLPMNQVGAAFLTLESTASEYAALMAVWQTLKSRLSNPWLEVRYEDMVEDLESVARKTLNFLGVSWDATVLGFDEHARKKTVRSPTYADVTQPIYQRAKGRWRNYQKHLEPHLAKLEPFVKAFGY